MGTLRAALAELTDDGDDGRIAAEDERREYKTKHKRRERAWAAERKRGSRERRRKEEEGRRAQAQDELDGTYALSPPERLAIALWDA